MTIKESTLTKLTITDVPHLDPINVIFEDYGPQRGKVTIEVVGDAWSYFWGAMGEGYTIKSFFLKANTDYLVGKLKIGIPPTINEEEEDALRSAAIKYILESRKKNEISKEKANYLWSLAEEIDNYGVDGNARTLEEIFGADWYYYLPQAPNPHYQHLCRIVDTIKEALRIPPEKSVT